MNDQDGDRTDGNGDGVAGQRAGDGGL